MNDYRYVVYTKHGLEKNFFCFCETKNLKHIDGCILGLYLIDNKGADSFRKWAENEEEKIKIENVIDIAKHYENVKKGKNITIDGEEYGYLVLRHIKDKSYCVFPCPLLFPTPSGYNFIARFNSNDEGEKQLYNFSHNSGVYPQANIAVSSFKQKLKNELKKTKKEKDYQYIIALHLLEGYYIPLLWNENFKFDHIIPVVKYNINDEHLFLDKCKLYNIENEGKRVIALYYALKDNRINKEFINALSKNPSLKPQENGKK